MLTTRVLVEELGECSLGRKLFDAREYLAPRLAQAERGRREFVLYVRRNKSFQSVGGAVQLDDAREEVIPERVAAVAQQVVDLGVVPEAALLGS